MVTPFNSGKTPSVTPGLPLKCNAYNDMAFLAALTSFEHATSINLVLLKSNMTKWGFRFMNWPISLTIYLFCEVKVNFSFFFASSMFISFYFYCSRITFHCKVKCVSVVLSLSAEKRCANDTWVTSHQERSSSRM